MERYVDSPISEAGFASVCSNSLAVRPGCVPTACETFCEGSCSKEYGGSLKSDSNRSKFSPKAEAVLPKMREGL